VKGEEHVLQRSFDLGFKDAADVGRKLGNIQGLLAALQTVASDDALKRELSCELQKWIELTHQKVNKGDAHHGHDLRTTKTYSLCS
jgi:hypothetical protein